MAHYSMNARHPLLSLTHHCLVQLLIHRGFALHNPPPLNNPPQQATEILQPAEENPQQAAKIQQPAAETPQLSTENPQQTPPLNEAESSTPIVYIPTDNSDDNTPIIMLKRKRKEKAATPLKRRTRASIKEATIPDNPPTLRKSARKRKTIVFPTSLPQRRTRMSAATEAITPNSPPIILKSRTPPSPKPSPSSPSGTKMQSVHDFVTSFFSKDAVAP